MDKNIDIIHINELGFSYPAEVGVIVALDGVTMRVKRGSFTSVIGRNGSGKSTLAKNVNALLVPTTGSVVVGGYDTREDAHIWEIRRMAGMVFQNPDNQLVSAVVEDDVAFGPENLGLPREEILERIRGALESVGMYEHRKMAPHLLSGGQKQRVAIAGVVAMKPDIVIFDEPTAMLDPSGREEVIAIAKRLHREGITVLLITHFMEETTESDRILIMDGGRIAMDGTPSEIYKETEEIRRLGLRLPFSVDVAERLRARGICFRADILDEGVLADEIMRCASERANPRNRDGNSQTSEVSDDAPVAQTAIRVENLTHIYNKGLAYETAAVTDVSFCVGTGEFVAIIGHTGSGKSTLIQHLNGLLKPTSGKVVVNGVNVTAKSTSVIEIRKKIGMIFQYPEYQLFEETVYKDIAFGPKNLGLDEDETDVRVKEAMALVGVDFSEFAHRSPFELSGGQKRKVAIAGVIAMRPEVLVLDEPTAGLDPRSHDDVLKMILGIRKRTGCTILLVSHNMEDVAQMADRVLLMEKGRVLKSGTPSEVFADEVFLSGVGLAPPPARAFANELVQRGLNLPSGIMTKEALVDELAEALSAKHGGSGDNRPAGDCGTDVPEETREDIQCGGAGR
jgi:energy-coupling factor transport system ATP-binding protein